MVLRQAMWTHGHSLKVEYPERGTIEYKGFSAKYKGNTAKPNWLHFAIPTPVNINDKPRVESVSLRFRGGGGAYLESIHVYDGEKKIAGEDDIHLRPTEWDIRKVDLPLGQKIQWGLGISVLVNFGIDDRWIEFSSAGASFFDGSNSENIIHVDSIGTKDDPKDLRKSSGDENYKVAIATGFWKKGDGGGGVFYWDNDTKSSDDDGGTVIVPQIVGSISNGCWKRLYSGDALDIRWFGAVSDKENKANNNVIAIQNALDVAGRTSEGYNGGRIVFTKGTWYINKTIILRKVDSVILTSDGGGGFVNVYDKGRGAVRKATRLQWTTKGAYDLKLMSLNSTDDLTQTEKNLVLVAKIGDSYYARIFDMDGKIVVDKQLQPDTTLKQELDKVFANPDIGEQTERELIRKITSSLGHNQVMLVIDGCFRCGVRGLSLDGGGVASVGIWLKGIKSDKPVKESTPCKLNLFDDFQVRGVKKGGIGIRVGDSSNSDIAANVFRHFRIESCDIGILQEGNQTVQTVWENGGIIKHTQYGMAFYGGDINTRNIGFGGQLASPTADNHTADVFVANQALYARFVNNYHETLRGSAYYFEPWDPSKPNRPHFTLLEGVRILYFNSTSSQYDPRRIIDYRQNGFVTMISCEFNGFNSKQGDSYVFFEQPFFEKYKLKLKPFNSTDALPQTENNLVLVAKIGNSYHARIFHIDGQILVDKQLQPDTNLKQELDKALANPAIGEQTERELVRKITSSLGHTQNKNPGYVQEIGCVYINKARPQPQPKIGFWASSYNYDPLGDDELPAPSKDYNNPGSRNTICNARLQLHNSILALQDNRTVAGKARETYRWLLRSDYGTLQLKSDEPRVSGALLTVANDSAVKFSLNHDGGPGFYGTSPPNGQPIVVGSRSDNTALKSLLDALVSLGLIKDSSVS